MPGPAVSGREQALTSALPWLAAVTLAGLVVRAIPRALSDFPVNDGGLFVAMVRAIQDAGWSLPQVAWVASDLEPNAHMAVITDSLWSGDADPEWFPLLAQRRSLATVQGSEWLVEAAFDRQVEAHRALRGCVRPASVRCVHEWLADWPADYLYLPTGQLHGPGSPADCCADLHAGVRADPAFIPIYRGAGATIFQVNNVSTAEGD